MTMWAGSSLSAWQPRGKQAATRKSPPYSGTTPHSSSLYFTALVSSLHYQARFTTGLSQLSSLRNFARLAHSRSPLD